MKLTLLLTASILSLSQSRLAFYNQRERLYIDEDTPLIELEHLFENRPLVFGLVSNKSRAINKEGYLCYAETVQQYIEKCKEGARLKNADWVTY